MIRNLLSLFILTACLFSFFAGSNGMNNFPPNNKHQISSEYSTTNASSILAILFEECHKSDSDNHKNHCTHHCNGMHTSTPSKIYISLNNPFKFNDKVFWYYNHHYTTPFLNPALKPPIFS